MGAKPDSGLNLTLAVTGASGAIYARHMLRALVRDARVARVHLVASQSSLRVLAEELGIAGRANLVARLLGTEYRDAASKVVQFSPDDIGAPIASGSYPIDAMLVLPCSMGTLAKISHGLAEDLIARAADVCLKERRRLILCVRETPFNLIHIRNMEQATLAGATIYPVIPTHYNHPATEQDMAVQYVHRVLAHIGLPQDGTYVWSGRMRKN